MTDELLLVPKLLLGNVPSLGVPASRSPRPRKVIHNREIIKEIREEIRPLS